ncbi:ArsB/NhaD family transporter [bacterium]|nr:ArsB/NhaD family transporter [bacterium]
MEALVELINNNAIVISAIILLVAYFFIATEKISKTTVALVGASITIILGLLGQNKFTNGDIDSFYFINFIDFNVIFLLVSMMIIVIISSRSGIYNWLANEMLKKTGGNPKLILLALGAFTAVASAFLDNVTTVILLMPITFLIAEVLEIDPRPFLITEIIASNIGGTSTLIGDPPNIIIGSAAHFSFLDFIVELTGIVFIIFVVAMAILFFIFRKQLVAAPEKMELIKNLDNTKTIKNKKLAIRSMTILLLVIIGFMLHDITHIQTCIVAMFGASILLIFEKPRKVFKDVEWSTIFFFIGLFIIIGGLEASGGIKMMSEWLLKVTHGSLEATTMVVLWASGILSGFIDNIPYTATMAPLVEQIQIVMGRDYAFPIWWALSLGACLGGNITIIGAAANVIVSETASSKDFKIPFLEYMKYGASITLIALAISSVYLWFRFLVK